MPAVPYVCRTVVGAAHDPVPRRPAHHVGVWCDDGAGAPLVAAG